MKKNTKNVEHSLSKSSLSRHFCIFSLLDDESGDKDNMTKLNTDVDFSAKSPSAHSNTMAAADFSLKQFKAKFISVQDSWLAIHLHSGEKYLVVVSEKQVQLPSTWGEFIVYVCEDNKNFKFPQNLEGKFISSGQKDAVRNAILKNSDMLMKCHSNLHAICASSFKFTDKTSECIPRTCIALYCRGKGFLPCGEEAFPTDIDGIPTDIREGYFTLGGKRRNRDLKRSGERHENLRIGVEIYANKFQDGKSTGSQGTLGGFVNLEGGRIGFLTCAHVIFTTNELLQQNLSTRALQVCNIK